MDGTEHTTPESPPRTTGEGHRSSHTAAQAELWDQPLPGYEILETLHVQRDARMLLARDLRLERTVAVKVLHLDLVHNENAIEHFFNEARNVARLRHPNLVRALDVGRAGSYFFFVMTHVRGQSLAQRLASLERSRLQEKEVLGILLRGAKGLQAIFEAGLAHRNIKPGNLLLPSSGGLRITETGVARELAYPSPEAFVRANAAYASPEAAEGETVLDIRADLYALGCCGYEALLGRPPFQGDTADVILQKHREEEPENPRDIDIRISAGTGQLLLWLLRKDRDRRPRTPQQVVSKMMEHPLIHEVLEGEHDGAAAQDTPGTGSGTGIDEAQETTPGTDADPDALLHGEA